MGRANILYRGSCALYRRSARFGTIDATGNIMRLRGRIRMFPDSIEGYWGWQDGPAVVFVA